MTAVLQTITRILAAGLAYAARTAAIREAMPWDDDLRRRKTATIHKRILLDGEAEGSTSLCEAPRA